MNHIPEESEHGEIRDGGARGRRPPDGEGGSFRSLQPDLVPDPGVSAAADSGSSAPAWELVVPGADPFVSAFSPRRDDASGGAGRVPPAAPARSPAGDASGEAAAGKEKEKEDEKPRSGILEALALVFVAFALALTLKSYVAEAYEIKGRSMEPSFRTGQRVIVLKTGYQVERGDVVVFASTEDPGKDLIKRVVGLPGERIACRDGKVFVNGKPLEELYVKKDAAPAYDPPREEEVPEGKFYVLGDNRPDSHDSRYFHSIPATNVKGEVVLRWWPFEDFDVFVK